MADEVQYVYSPTRIQQPGVDNVVFVYEATTMQPCTMFHIELPVAPPAATPEMPMADDKFTCEVGRVWDVQSKDGYVGWTHVPRVVVPAVSDTAVDGRPTTAAPPAVKPVPAAPPPVAAAPEVQPVSWLTIVEVALHRTVEHAFDVLHWLRRGGR
jgi:hypothetical protein